ncbi:MAG: type II secretion system protein [Candidatus Omnitrophota bacterium]
MRIFRASGHSLVELMIVVSILGLLAMIAVPNFISAHTSAAQRACIQNMRQFEAAIQTYHVDTGAWPTMLGDLAPYILNSVPTICPDDGAPYTLKTGGGITYSSCPNHGNVIGF